MPYSYDIYRTWIIQDGTLSRLDTESDLDEIRDAYDISAEARVTQVPLTRFRRRARKKSSGREDETYDMDRDMGVTHGNPPNSDPALEVIKYQQWAEETGHHSPSTSVLQKYFEDVLHQDWNSGNARDLYEKMGKEMGFFRSGYY